jgi:hypothetical protein
MEPSKTFKSDAVHALLEEWAAHLRLADIAFTLYDVDHVWPKVGLIDGRCRCPKHRHATENLFWTCYDRIMKAKNSIPLESIEELANKLLGVQREVREPGDEA